MRETVQLKGGGGRERLLGSGLILFRFVDSCEHLRWFLILSFHAAVNPTSSPNPVRTVRPTRPPVTIPPTVRIPQPLPSSINFRVNVVPSSTIRRPGGASFMVCNAQLPPGYVTSSIEWGKNDGSPLPFGRTKRYTCNTVLYMHDLTSRDAGFYSCRVEATNSVGQRISSQGISNVRVVGEYPYSSPVGLGPMVLHVLGKLHVGFPIETA